MSLVLSVIKHDILQAEYQWFLGFAPDWLLMEQFSFECQKAIGFVSTTLHDWLKNFAPIFHPIRSKSKPLCLTRSCFPELCISRMHVITSSFDWFTGLPAVYSVTSKSNYFDFGSKTPKRFALKTSMFYVIPLRKSFDFLINYICIRHDNQTINSVGFIIQWNPFYGHPLNADACFLRTVSFVPAKSSYIFSKINPLYTDTG